MIWGTGEQDRNFAYVGDIADGMIRAAEQVQVGRAVDIGTTEHIKMKDAAQVIFQIVGSTPEKIHFHTAKPVGVFSRAADLTRCRDLLDWEPSTSFEAGVLRTIDWYSATKDSQAVAAKLDELLMER